jgi:hypothetical protein
MDDKTTMPMDGEEEKMPVMPTEGEDMPTEEETTKDVPVMPMEEETEEEKTDEEAA